MSIKRIVTVVSLLLAAGMAVFWLTTDRGGSPPPSVAATSVTPSTVPSPAITSQATGGPVPTDPVDDPSLRARVLAFETAINILDPTARIAAVKPYSAPEYETFLQGQLEDTDLVKELRKGDTSTVDTTNAEIYIEALDPTTLEVTTIVKKTVTSDGVVIPRNVTHKTYWILSKDEGWVAYADRP